jgi:hypothetical protein
VLEPKTLGGFFAVIAFTVGANLMLKLGAGASEVERVFGLLGWKSVAGLALFGCGGIVYAFLLRRVPLNIAQVFTSAPFVGVSRLSGSVSLPAWCWASRFRPRAGSESPASAWGSPSSALR